MSKADQVIDRAANKLRQFADRASAEGGIAAMFAEPLAEDSAFLRKLKPSLIAARFKGEAPANQPAGSTGPTAPTSPQLGKRPKSKKKGGGPNPFLVIGAALAVGIVLAKVIDWRGHAHPRD
jgi:hypothetical protein